MTVSTTTNKVTYTGNGVTTVFPFTFPVFDDADLTVYLYTIASKTLVVVDPANYTISGGVGGGSVTYNPAGVPVPSTKRLIIVRTVALIQALDIENEGGFHPDSLEDQLDLIEMQIQQSQAVVTLSPAADPVEMPLPEAGKLLGWNGSDELFNTEIGTLGAFVIGVDVQAWNAVHDQAVLNDASNYADLGTAIDASSNLTVPADTYDLASDVTPALKDGWLKIDPAASFIGAGALNLLNWLEYQFDPIVSYDLIRKTFGAEIDAYANVFLRASHVKTTSPTAAVVAYYGMGDAAANAARAWGGNFAAYASASGAIAIGAEINYGVLAAGGLAYGIVVASAGSEAPNAAIQIQSNSNDCVPAVAIRFNAGGGFEVASEALMATDSALTSEYGINLSTGVFTTAEMFLPSFAVGATPANNVNRMLAIGGATGTSPHFEASGNDANLDAILRGKGTGGGKLQDGSAVDMIEWNSTGIGFFNTAPVAKPTGVAVSAADIHAALVTLGLIAA